MLKFVLRRVLERLSLILAVVGAGLATALISGNGTLAATAGIVAALVVLMALPRPRRHSPRGDETSGPSSPLAPFCFRYAWTTAERPDLAAAARELAQRGLVSSTDVQSERKLVLKGGSQLHARLLGGYFVRPEHLPILVELTLTDDGDGSHTLRLEASDRMVIGVRDRRLEARYGLAAAQIRETVESSLGSVRQAEASH